MKIEDGVSLKECVFFIENDGRDFEVEGDLSRAEVVANMDELISSGEGCRGV